MGLFGRDTALNRQDGSDNDQSLAEARELELSSLYLPPAKAPANCQPQGRGAAAGRAVILGLGACVVYELLGSP